MGEDGFALFLGAENRRGLGIGYCRLHREVRVGANPQSLTLICSPINVYGFAYPDRSICGN